MDEGIRYYSDAATYRKAFKVAWSSRRNPNSRIYLDLGKVAVIAEVILNGTNPGILWKAPYRLDVTDGIKSEENALELKIVNV